jgi:hypothetical protein
MKNLKSKGRPSKAEMSPVALDEIKKFFDGYASLRAAAKVLGVSSTAAWSWRHGKFRPKEKYVNKMIKLSKGAVSKDKLMHQLPNKQQQYNSFLDYMMIVHIKPKADIMGLKDVDYYNNYTHPKVKKIIEKYSLSEIDIPLLHAFYGESLDYWINIVKNFNFTILC